MPCHFRGSSVEVLNSELEGFLSVVQNLFNNPCSSNFLKLVDGASGIVVLTHSQALRKHGVLGKDKGYTFYRDRLAKSDAV